MQERSEVSFSWPGKEVSEAITGKRAHRIGVHQAKNVYLMRRGEFGGKERQLHRKGGECRKKGYPRCSLPGEESPWYKKRDLRSKKKTKLETETRNISFSGKRAARLY